MGVPSMSSASSRCRDDHGAEMCRAQRLKGWTVVGDKSFWDVAHCIDLVVFLPIFHIPSVRGPNKKLLLCCHGEGRRPPRVSCRGDWG